MRRLRVGVDFPFYSVGGLESDLRSSSNSSNNSSSSFGSVVKCGSADRKGREEERESERDLPAEHPFH